MIKSLAADLVSGYGRLRARLAECPETEGEQAVIRLAVGRGGIAPLGRVHASLSGRNEPWPK